MSSLQSREGRRGCTGSYIQLGRIGNFHSHSEPSIENGGAEEEVLEDVHEDIHLYGSGRVEQGRSSTEQ